MSRRAQKQAKRHQQRVDTAAAELRVVKVRHYSGAHLWRPGSDVTFCQRPARDPSPADLRWEKVCMRCADGAQALTA